MEYEIILKPSARNDIDKLSEREVKRVSERLFQIGNNPRPIGVQKLTAEEGYRIKHRKDVYR